MRTENGLESSDALRASNGSDELSVAVIVATFNRARYLPTCLDSVLKQTLRPAELIVVDDGSTDDTNTVLRNYENHIKVLSQANSGKAAALNNALEHVSSSHVCFFDDDDVLLPDALERHVAFLRANTNLDYSYSAAILYEQKTEVGSDIWNQSNWRIDPIQHDQDNDVLFSTMLWNNALLQGMVIRRTCAQGINGFDTAYDRSQDYEFMLRLATSFVGGDVGQPTLVFRQHSGARGPAAHRHRASQRDAIAHEYEKRMFRSLRKTLPLERYLALSRRFSTTESESSWQKEALYRRALVMFRRGLFEEAMEDVVRVVNNMPCPIEIQEKALKLAADAANINKPHYMLNARFLVQGLQSIEDRQCRAWLRARMRKGLVWTALRARRLRAYRGAYAVLQASLTLELSTLNPFRPAPLKS